MAVALGVDDIVLVELLRERILFFLFVKSLAYEHVVGQVSLDFFIAFGLFLHELSGRMALHVRVDNEGGKHLILFLVDFVTDDGEQVESGQDRVRQINVVIEIKLSLVDTTNRVSGSNNRTACLERRDDASFRYRNRLLLHRLVNRGSVLFVHLIELIDEADTFISEDKSATLKSPLTSDRVLVHASRQTDGTRTLARCVNDTVIDLLDVLEELRLGGTRVTE